jgi:hypothetical protein
VPMNTTRSWYISLGIGVLILALLSSLPQVGWIVNALALFFGLGAILTVIQAEFGSIGDAPLRTAPVYYPSTPMPTVSVNNAVPLLEERASSPGMDNLPNGFDLEWLNRD